MYSLFLFSKRNFIYYGCLYGTVDRCLKTLLSKKRMQKNIKRECERTPTTTHTHTHTNIHTRRAHTIANRTLRDDALAFAFLLRSIGLQIRELNGVDGASSALANKRHGASSIETVFNKRDGDQNWCSSETSDAMHCNTRLFQSRWRHTVERGRYEGRPLRNDFRRRTHAVLVVHFVKRHACLFHLALVIAGLRNAHNVHNVVLLALLQV